jgi:predicted acylesterase/phospholipase RssA
VARPIIRPASARKPIGLALQGGGSWGAYTWGVLDALLASRSITIAQLIGISAGAINAAVIAARSPTDHRRRRTNRFSFVDRCLQGSCTA